ASPAAPRASESVPPDEGGVELDVVPVAEVPGREVVVLDPRGGEAAADRGRALVAVRREPFPACLEALARVDGRQRTGDPARLERVRRVGATADLPEPELLAGGHDPHAHALAGVPAGGHDP